MNLLIHDLSAAEWAHVADNYEDWTVVADTGGIRPCRGCFHCWVSGTGVCAVKDGYENMGQLIHEADEVVVMSRYTYGGFSSFVKNVFDRSLGYVLPEFETAFGEMHHQKRYAEDKPVTFVFRGTGLTEEDKRKIRELSEGKAGQKTKSGQKKAVRKKRSEKSGQKTVDKLLSLLKANPRLTQEGMVNALMVTRSTIQKHLANLKSAGRIRRVGPDKGGHWEVLI